MATATETRIKFDDGYKVEITPTKLTVRMQGKSLSADPLYLRETDNDQSIIQRLRKQGVDPADYLTNATIVVRRGNGVGEAIREATADRRAERDREYARQRADMAAEEALARGKAAEDNERADVEEARLVAQIPPGGVRVHSTQTGSADGDPILDYEADGMPLSWRDVQHVGTVQDSKVVGGRLSACVRVVEYIMRADLEAIRAKLAADAAAKAQARVDAEAARAKAFATAAETGEKQELFGRVVDCDESVPDCSTDFVTTWAMPDGSQQTTRTHTY